MAKQQSSGATSNLFPLSALERHDYILKTYILNRNVNNKHKRDIDVIKEHHRFLWDDEDEADTWEARLARRYYDKLFREYCIADLTRFKENKIALRWRTEAEVVTGKGQFQCGSRKCEEREELRSWEVNFAYLENKERKNALVKVRLCPVHSDQLNFRSRKREVKRLKHMEKKQKRQQRKEHRSRDEVEETTTTSDAEKSTEEDNTSDKEEDNSETQKTADDSNQPKSMEHEDVWSKKLEVELEPTSRETDFERYLEDLLL